MFHNWFTKNTQDVVMANRLYKVKTNKTPTGNSDLEKVVDTMNDKRDFSFGAWLQFWQRNFGCCFKDGYRFQQL